MRDQRRRRRDRGQVVPIAAICSALLIGGAALAVDLSLQTDRHLDLQNATDAAALVAARDLGATNSGQPNQPDRKQGAIDALKVVYDHMGWGTTATTWATTAVGTTCDTGTNCHVSATGPGGGSGVSVNVDIPPRGAGNTTYNEQGTTGLPWGYAHVTLRELQVSSFTGSIGFARQTAGAHSIGFHFPGGQPFGFALYSGTVVATGNSTEVVSGNVYAYRDIKPQSNGQASFCADTDGKGNKGNIVLGAPQVGPFPNPDPAAGAAYQRNVVPAGAQVLANTAACSTVNGGGVVAQSAALGSCGTLSVQGVTMSTTQDTGSLACMANPPLAPPDLQGPSLAVGNIIQYDGTKAASGAPVLTVTSPLAQGLYYITHNPTCVAPGCTDVVIDKGAPSNCTGTYTPAYTTCLIGITFWLDRGATIGVSKGANVLISPYWPATDPSLNPNNGRFSIYAPLGSTAGMYVSNIQTTLVMTGTTYMPSGTMNVTQNATLGINGQAIVNQWSVQSGNHTNPEIQYDANAVAKQREVLQLVE
jgi:hypothetical protein